MQVVKYGSTDVGSLLHGYRRGTRQWLSGLMREARLVSRNENVGVAFHTEIGLA
jgi:hypothetical protein